MVAYNGHSMVSSENIARVVIVIVERVKEGFDLLHYGVYSSNVVHVFLMKVHDMWEISREHIPWSAACKNGLSYPSLRGVERRRRLQNVVDCIVVYQ
jgi:hypothetical protein